MVQTTLYLNKAKGPSWVGLNYDPDYMYLLNSLNLARMKGVGHTDNPGTTVQLTGAIILRATHLFSISSKADLQTDVLKKPEFYLAVINKVFLAFNTLMLIILGMVTLWLTKNVMMSIIIQLSPFFSSIEACFIRGLTAVRPESFLLLSSLLFVLLIIIYAYKDTERISHCLSNTGYLRKLSPHSFFTICFSVVSGFGMATKATFMPLLVIPLIVLPSYKNKIMYVLGTSLSFIFFTLPIIKEYGKLFDGLFFIITHTGIHRMGTEKLIEPSLYLSNLRQLFLGNGFFSIVLFFSMCILMMSYIVPRFRKVSIGNINFRLLLGVSLSQLMGVMMTAKHFRGWEHYYLLPVLSLSGVTLMLIICCLRQIGNEFNIEINSALFIRKVSHLIFKLNGKWLLFVIIIYFLFYSKKNEVSGNFIIRSQRLVQHLTIYNKVENDYKNYAKIYYLGSSSPAYALSLGDINAKKYNAEFLKKVYPNAYFYYPWNGKYSNWENEVHFEEIVSKHGEKIIFQGPKFDELFSGFFNNPIQASLRKPDLLLIDVFKENKDRLLLGPHETIYEIDFPSK